MTGKTLKNALVYLTIVWLIWLTIEVTLLNKNLLKVSTMLVELTNASLAIKETFADITHEQENQRKMIQRMLKNEASNSLR